MKRETKRESKSNPPARNSRPELETVDPNLVTRFYLTMVTNLLVTNLLLESGCFDGHWLIRRHRLEVVLENVTFKFIESTRFSGCSCRMMFDSRRDEQFDHIFGYVVCIARLAILEHSSRR